MKELSIEEKAKRYDEAIERAKQIQSTPYTAHWDTMKEVCEELFPELKESEDERTRKELLFFLREAGFNRNLDTKTPYDKFKRWSNWVVKQGEKDSEVKLPTFTFDDVLALQCCMETVKKVQEDKDLYNELLLLHNKVHDAYTITKDKLL